MLLKAQWVSVLLQFGIETSSLLPFRPAGSSPRSIKKQSFVVGDWLGFLLFFNFPPRKKENDKT
jgi:hypothetical protein